MKNLFIKFSFIMFCLINITVKGAVDTTSCFRIFQEEPRPILPKQIFSQHFIVHYDSLKTTDSYAQNTINFAEYAFQKICLELGWKIPPSDSIMGDNDNRYDIYIVETTSFRGLTVPIVPVNWNNEWACSFIEIKNGLEVDTLKVVVAHEFNHACQFAYTCRDGVWFYENTATYIGDYIYNEQIRYYMRFFQYFNPLVNTEVEITFDEGFYKYGGFLWPKFLVEYTKDISILRKIWEMMNQNIGNHTIEDISYILLTQYNINFSMALEKYAEWRYFTGIRDDQKHFNYANQFPTSNTIVASLGTNGYVDGIGGPGGTIFIKYSNINNEVLNFSLNGYMSDKWKANLIKHSIEGITYQEEINFNGATAYLETITRGINDVSLIPVNIITDKNIGRIDYIGNISNKRAILFANKYENNNLGGNLLLNDVEQIISDNMKILNISSINNIKTLNERFNIQPYSIYKFSVKHNNWNNVLTDSKLNNVFDVRQVGNNDQIANFLQLKYAKLEVRLDGELINGAGKIQFQDPWYVLSDGSQPGNYWINFTTQYEPTGKEGAIEKGVFLNQGWPGWQPPYYSVRANQTYQFNGINYKFIGWTAEPFNSAEFQNQRALQTPVVFKNENAIINGFYKGNFVTNSSNALTTNSQRKLLSIDDTNFLVYESDNKIFFTAKQPLENNWEPEYLISNINHQAKNPSADYYNYNIAVVYEYYNPMNNEYGIYLWESVNFDTIGTYTKVADINSNYFGRAKPVVAYSNGEIFIAYKKSETEGIKFRRKYKNSSGEWIWSSESTIPYTNAYSINVSIAVGPKYSFTNYVHLVWEETNKIKYLHGYWQAYDRRFNDYYEISNGSGYKSNEQPIVSLTEGELYPIVSWIVGNNLIAQKVSKETILNEKKIITRVKHSNWGDFFITGNDVEYGVNSSTSSSNAESIIAWSEANGQRSKYVKRIGTNYSSIKNISPIGLHLQLSNGNNLSDIKGVIYTPSGSLPYVFHDITTLFDGSIQLSKENNDNKIFYGRTGVINKSDLQFVFNIGDILVDDEEVKFVEKLDTIPVSNIEELNFAMRTNKFKLNNNSEFYFSNFYYVLNADLADSIMSNNDKFIFKVELIKDTEEIVGVLEKVEFDKNNLNEFNNINYQVNCEGIEEGEYYLRLVADFYGKNEVYLSNIMNEDINFEKKHYEDVYFDGKTLPTTYELSQNYPNPFNPSTTINYQIPKAGFVSLKVYDILGREVAVLVSGEKEVGKYTVQFDGSKLASGVYIYELRANEFVSVKKLMLLK